MVKYWILVFLVICEVCEVCAMPPEQAIKRINAHLLIYDPNSACEEARQGLSEHPSYVGLWEHYIKALARQGNEKSMARAWQEYAKLAPKPYENHELIEEMAWCTIKQGSHSSTPLIRIVALLGAFLAQDAKGVDILHAHLQDNNCLIRSAAVQLVAKMRDAKLCDAMLQLLRKEKSWEVHLEAIKAVGAMKIHAAKPDLIRIVSSDQVAAEEKAAAIQALVNLIDAPEREEVTSLAHSNRSGLRLLACEVIAHCALERDLDQIALLLNDYHAEVRSAALQTLGFLRIESLEGRPISEIARDMAKDPDPLVGITAAWALTLNKPQEGQRLFAALIKHNKQEIRLLAAAALSSCGHYGYPFTEEAFRSAKDQYVRINLALALLGQRKEIPEACEVLYECLKTNKSYWMWTEDLLFKRIIPNKLLHKNDDLEHPDSIDQIVRLEVLSTMAMMEDKHAQLAITDFLEHRTWGISGLASALLLTEGDEAAIDVVKKLLEHTNHKVRVQAALILSLWSREESAINVLEQSYDFADRELKEKIIEGIGRVGATSSIPFLISKLNEPYQSLRIFAASALLECLYH